VNQDPTLIAMMIFAAVFGTFIAVFAWVISRKKPEQRGFEVKTKERENDHG
jgi:hypothetical protein